MKLITGYKREWKTGKLGVLDHSAEENLDQLKDTILMEVMTLQIQLECTRI